MTGQPGGLWWTSDLDPSRAGKMAGENIYISRLKATSPPKPTARMGRLWRPAPAEEADGDRLNPNSFDTTKAWTLSRISGSFQSRGEPRALKATRNSANLHAGSSADHHPKQKWEILQGNQRPGGHRFSGDRRLRGTRRRAYLTTCRKALKPTNLRIPRGTMDSCRHINGLQRAFFRVF